MNKNLFTKKISVFSAAAVFYLIGQYFRGYWWPDFTWPFHCYQITFGSSSYCDSIYLNTLGWPFIAAGEVLAIVGLVLLFANERGFRSWWYMSIWFVPLAVLAVIFVTPQLIFPIDARASYDGMVWLFGYLYIFITLGIIAWRRFVRP